MASNVSGGGGDITVEAWVNFYQLQNVTIFDLGDPAQNTGNLYAGLTGGGRPYVQVQNQFYTANAIIPPTKQWVPWEADRGSAELNHEVRDPPVIMELFTSAKEFKRDLRLSMTKGLGSRPTTSIMRNYWRPSRSARSSGSKSCWTRSPMRPLTEPQRR